MKARVFSAIVAVIILIGTYVGLSTQGLRYVCVFGGSMSIIEFARLTFPRLESPKHVEISFIFFAFFLFYVTSGGIFGDSALGRLDLALSFGAIAAVTLTSLILLTIRSAEDLSVGLQVQSLAVMGLIYCGVFPGLVTRLLSFENGQSWFFGFLAIVFSGDTFAFFAGKAFGRRKLLEPVSPKKTLEGSFGGLVGSALAGWILARLCFPQIPSFELVLLAIVTGAFAQMGDLFESLLKRVAEVKDSGGIMPGHGGVLDRLDGVLFAAPVYFALVWFLS